MVKRGQQSVESCTVRRKTFACAGSVRQKDQYMIKLLTNLKFLFFKEDFLERVRVISLNKGSWEANRCDIMLLAAVN